MTFYLTNNCSALQIIYNFIFISHSSEFVSCNSDFFPPQNCNLYIFVRLRLTIQIFFPLEIVYIIASLYLNWLYILQFWILITLNDFFPHNCEFTILMCISILYYILFNIWDLIPNTSLLESFLLWLNFEQLFGI